MRVLFLALGKYTSIYNRGIYLDLLRVFVLNNHEVFIITSLEQDCKDSFQLIEEERSHILKVKTGRITKTNILEKGINTLLIEKKYIKAIDNHFSSVKFDLVIYPTPPITFLKVVKFIKKRDSAKSYLMLKDIFPQNSVDIGIMTKSGVKGIIYRFFRKKEKKLYAISDHIGCMSQANVDYLLKHNPEINPSKVDVCPNSTEIEDKSVDEGTKSFIRKKYEIPLDKTVFVYGGNLGKPQGISFLIDCLKAVKDNQNVFFLVIGDGTEYKKIEAYSREANQNNFKLMKRLPKDDYDSMVGACDIGMIFLDHRFTIPNFPSRLLSYMSAKVPVFAITDPNTDIGTVITEGGFGWWCESNDSQKFADIVEEIRKEDLGKKKSLEFEYLKKHYDVMITYHKIIDKLDNI